MPRFEDENSLNASPWGKYFESVYGSVPPSGSYPICIFDFGFLYKDKYEAAGLGDATSSKCPSNEGDYFSGGIRFFTIKQAMWIYHPGPYNALQSNTWVEGTHATKRDPDLLGKNLQSRLDESEGAWMFLAPGSGLWVNLGNTKAYKEHGDIWGDFTDCQKGEYNTLCTCAKQNGVDSLQFLEHDDPEWDCKGVGPAKSSGGEWRQGSSPLAIEIVICRLDGSKTCGGVGDAYRSGWMASEACDCDEDGGSTNCRNKGIAPR